VPLRPAAIMRCVASACCLATVEEVAVDRQCGRSAGDVGDDAAGRPEPRTDPRVCHGHEIPGRAGVRARVYGADACGVRIFGITLRPQGHAFMDDGG
jgi:hypothetical protein